MTGKHMAGGFAESLFNVEDLNDEFFVPLRADYGGVEFDNWYRHKAAAGESAVVYMDDAGIAGIVG